MLLFSWRSTVSDKHIAKAEDGNAAKNLKIWRTATAEIVAEFVQKGSQEEYNLQYTYDEKYCARAVTNEVQFYESEKMNAGNDQLPSLPCSLLTDGNSMGPPPR